MSVKGFIWFLWVRVNQIENRSYLLVAVSG